MIARILVNKHTKTGCQPTLQAGKEIPIRRIAFLETGVSRHHGGPIEGLTALSCWGFKGGALKWAPLC